MSRTVETATPPEQRRTWIPLVFVGVFAVFGLHAWYLQGIAEDAYITFRFARNLAAGYGFAWNAGGPPVEGFTNFLLVVLCAIPERFEWNTPRFSQGLGIAASIATLFCTWLFARRALRLPRSASLVPCILLAVSGPFATWATAGLETNIFGFFVLLACLLFVRFWNDGSQLSLILCYVALLFASTTRPEGVMVFALLTGLGLLLATGPAGRRVGAIVGASLFYIVPFAVYFAWRWNHFGYPLPNTFYAKTGGTLLQYGRGALYVAHFCRSFLTPLLPLVLVLVWERGASISSPWRWGWHDLRASIREHVGLGTCVVIVAPYCAYMVYVGGDYMAMFRFFVPLLPLIYLLAGSVIHALLQEVSGCRAKRVLAGCLLVVAVGGTLIHSTPVDHWLLRQQPLNHGQYVGVQAERWHVSRLNTIGDFFNDYSRNASESLATDAIGAIAYRTSLQIIGLHGLVDPHIAHQPVDPNIMGGGVPGHERGDLVYVFSQEPTYFMFDRRLTEEPGDYPVFLENINDMVRERYRVTAVRLRDEANSEEGFFTFLELRDQFRPVAPQPRSSPEVPESTQTR